MWYFMLNSGVHATITGVLLAFAIPFGKGDEKSPSYILQHILHKPVAFIILPLFALANTAIPIQAGLTETLQHPINYGIMAGLVIGKPLGIVLFSYLLIQLKWGKLPAYVSWKQMSGIGMLAGIGFTMSIFIATLAFSDVYAQDLAKVSILLASLLSVMVGSATLAIAAKRPK
jgi:NhaA family Na+:H+ antiporter